MYLYKLITNKRKEVFNIKLQLSTVKSLLEVLFQRLGYAIITSNEDTLKGSTASTYTLDTTNSMAVVIYKLLIYAAYADLEAIPTSPNTHHVDTITEYLANVISSKRFIAYDTAELKGDKKNKVNILADYATDEKAEALFTYFIETVWNYYIDLESKFVSKSGDTLVYLQLSTDKTFSRVMSDAIMAYPNKFRTALDGTMRDKITAVIYEEMRSSSGDFNTDAGRCISYWEKQPTPPREEKDFSVYSIGDFIGGMLTNIIGRHSKLNKLNLTTKDSVLTQNRDGDNDYASATETYGDYIVRDIDDILLDNFIKNIKIFDKLLSNTNNISLYALILDYFMKPLGLRVNEVSGINNNYVTFTYSLLEIILDGIEDAENIINIYKLWNDKLIDNCTKPYAKFVNDNVYEKENSIKLFTAMMIACTEAIKINKKLSSYGFSFASIGITNIFEVTEDTLSEHLSSLYSSKKSYMLYDEELEEFVFNFKFILSDYEINQKLKEDFENKVKAQGMPPEKLPVLKYSDMYTMTKEVQTEIKESNDAATKAVFLFNSTRNKILNALNLKYLNNSYIVSKETNNKNYLSTPNSAAQLYITLLRNSVTTSGTTNKLMENNALQLFGSTNISEINSRVNSDFNTFLNLFDDSYNRALIQHTITSLTDKIALLNNVITILSCNMDTVCSTRLDLNQSIGIYIQEYTKPLLTLCPYTLSFEISRDINLVISVLCNNIAWRQKYSNILNSISVAESYCSKTNRVSLSNIHKELLAIFNTQTSKFDDSECDYSELSYITQKARLPRGDGYTFNKNGWLMKNRLPYFELDLKYNRISFFNEKGSVLTCTLEHEKTVTKFQNLLQ